MELSDYKVALEWDIEYLYIYMLTIAGQTDRGATSIFARGGGAKYYFVNV